MQIRLQQIEGYAYGALQPSIIIRFSEIQTPSNEFKNQLKLIHSYIPNNECNDQFLETTEIRRSESFAKFFVAIIDAINYFCGDQRYTPITIFRENGALCFALPTLSLNMIAFNINNLANFLSRSKLYISKKDTQKLITQLKSATRPFLPSGTNAGNFLAAAAHHKIPFKIFNQQYILFGYGSGSRIFNSSITDEESAIGVRLAKSKVDTNRLLKLSGIPVPEQARVNKINDALNFADRVRYPVVLKPEHEEQGRGVFANISDREELKIYLDQLQSRYKSILIEKHVDGDVYRMNTINGQFVRVVKRIGAQLVGNGYSTVSELLAELNNEPLRLDPHSSMNPIALDDDVKRMLLKQSASVDTILPEGKSIRLTSIASRGAHSIDFIDSIHPDNRALCEKVAAIMRLDVTGIDVISADASKSWREGNFWICEVNAQPQLGTVRTDIYETLLKSKIGEQPNIHINITTNSKATALFDPQAQSLELELTPDSVFQNGCPVQYFNTLEFSDDVPEFAKERMKKILVSVKPDL